MILDYLYNIDRYSNLHPSFQAAFNFLKNKDLLKMPTNKYEIDGDSLFVILDKSPGRKKEDAMLEIHKKYIDIQLILAGEDKMGWKSKQQCEKPDADYDSTNDIQFFKDRPSDWFTVKPGMFAIFFPEDAHLPLIGDSIIHKAIAKIAI